MCERMPKLCSTRKVNPSCCPLRPRTTPFPEEKTTLGVICGVLLCAEINAANPLGARGALYFPLQVVGGSVAVALLLCVVSDFQSNSPALASTGEHWRALASTGEHAPRHRRPCSLDNAEALAVFCPRRTQTVTSRTMRAPAANPIIFHPLSCGLCWVCVGFFNMPALEAWFDVLGEDVDVCNCTVPLGTGRVRVCACVCSVHSVKVCHGLPAQHGCGLHHLFSVIRHATHAVRRRFLCPHDRTN